MLSSATVDADGQKLSPSGAKLRVEDAVQDEIGAEIAEQQEIGDRVGRHDRSPVFERQFGEDEHVGGTGQGYEQDDNGNQRYRRRIFIIVVCFATSRLRLTTRPAQTSAAVSGANQADVTEDENGERKEGVNETADDAVRELHPLVDGGHAPVVEEAGARLTDGRGWHFGDAEAARLRVEFVVPEAGELNDDGKQEGAEDDGDVGPNGDVVPRLEGEADDEIASHGNDDRLPSAVHLEYVDQKLLEIFFLKSSCSEHSRTMLNTFSALDVLLHPKYSYSGRIYSSYILWVVTQLLTRPGARYKIY